MNEVIIVRPDKCVGCNACVRNCPAPEANITRQIDGGKFITTVNPERCITCGECVRTCNHGARDYIDDTDEFMSELSRRKMIILATPAIKTVYPGHWKGILDHFKKKGCLVYDVSFGADICTWAHLRSITAGNVGNLITQPCAAIVKYIEIYQPMLLKNLSPIHSPISCAAIFIRKYLKRNEPIAVLSPCIAKKTEFSETGTVNYNVTFNKLNDYFEKNNIRILPNSTDNFEYEFENTQGQVGAVYPRPGGLRDNLWLHDPDINITTSEGVHKVYPELDMYAQMPESKHPEVFDVLSCEFGCNVGPASGNKQTVFDVMASMREIERESKKKRKTGLFKTGEDKLFKKFDEELIISDFIRNYRQYVPTPIPSDKDLEPIFDKMGKHTPEDKRYDCHACGYTSCKAMATAIYRGLNTPDNCSVHAKSVLISRHSALAEQHEKLADITDKCLDLSNKLIKDLDDITQSISTIGDASEKTDERAGTVHDLLENVVSFCESSDSMDADSIEKLITILKTTISAFDTLNDNIIITNTNSAKIKESITEITDFVSEINKTLALTSQ